MGFVIDYIVKTSDKRVSSYYASGYNRHTK